MELNIHQKINPGLAIISSTKKNLHNLISYIKLITKLVKLKIILYLN